MEEQYTEISEDELERRCMDKVFARAAIYWMTGFSLELIAGYEGQIIYLRQRRHESDPLGIEVTVHQTGFQSSHKRASYMWHQRASSIDTFWMSENQIEFAHIVKGSCGEWYRPQPINHPELLQEFKGISMWLEVAEKHPEIMRPREAEATKPELLGVMRSRIDEFLRDQNKVSCQSVNLPTFAEYKKVQYGTW